MIIRRLIGSDLRGYILTHDRPNTGNKGGVLAGAAEAATKAVQAVKDSMSGSNK